MLWANSFEYNSIVQTFSATRTAEDSWNNEELVETYEWDVSV